MPTDVTKILEQVGQVSRAHVERVSYGYHALKLLTQANIPPLRFVRAAHKIVAAIEAEYDDVMPIQDTLAMILSEAKEGPPY